MHGSWKGRWRCDDGVVEERWVCGRQEKEGGRQVAAKFKPKSKVNQDKKPKIQKVKNKIK
jgi:hypothetical protein